MRMTLTHYDEDTHEKVEADVEVDDHRFYVRKARGAYLRSQHVAALREQAIAAFAFQQAQF